MQESYELRRIKDIQEGDYLEDHATKEVSPSPEENIILSWASQAMDFMCY